MDKALDTYLKLLHASAISAVGILFYASGLLVWPVCAILWRRKRRTTALRWTFFAQLACSLALGGFALFSGVKLDHGYYWSILFIMLNIVFTFLAFFAAIIDYVKCWKLDNYMGNVD